MLFALLLAAVVQGSAPPARHDLESYLRLATAYAHGQRGAALAEIRGWTAKDLAAAAGELRRREGELRTVPRATGEIAFALVESAVLLHADAGLVALAAGRDGYAEADLQLRTSNDLLGWSHAAAARRKLVARIDGGDYYTAIAAASLSFGLPVTAARFARAAKEVRPIEAEVCLLVGCAAASLAELLALAHEPSDAERARNEAQKALEDALALSPGLAEAQLRLAKLRLDQRRAIEAESLLAAVDDNGDGRQRYLARLFLARAAEQRKRPEDAQRAYRRALAAWPDSQAARMGLACLLEASGGPAAARDELAATLAASRRDARAGDPWWTFPLGPPGLASRAIDRLWTRVVPP